MNRPAYSLDGCLAWYRAVRQQADTVVTEARAGVEALQQQSAALLAEIHACGHGGLLVQASARRFVAERWQALLQCRSRLAGAEVRLAAATVAAADAYRWQRRFELHRERFLAQAQRRACRAGYRCQDDAALEAWRMKGAIR